MFVSIRWCAGMKKREIMVENALFMRCVTYISVFSAYMMRVRATRWEPIVFSDDVEKFMHSQYGREDDV